MCSKILGDAKVRAPRYPISLILGAAGKGAQLKLIKFRHHDFEKNVFD